LLKKSTCGVLAFQSPQRTEEYASVAFKAAAWHLELFKQPDKELE